MFKEISKHLLATLLFVFAAEFVTRALKAANGGWYGFVVFICGIVFLMFVFKFLAKAVNHD